MKVFWSWQSDTPGKIGRHFVREALELAIAQLRQAPDIEEPSGRETREALHLDHDRKDVPGSPRLAETIFEKITASAVVIADVTPVGKVPKVPGSTRRTRAKKIMNPNVAIEVGYALHASPGKEKSLLMVLNEHYGSRADVPFDLQQNAGPIMYQLTPDANKDEIDRARSQLAGVLKTALAPFLTAGLPTVTPSSSAFIETPTKGSLGTWFDAHEVIASVGVLEDKIDFRFDTASGLYLRLIPTTRLAAPIPLAMLNDSLLHSAVIEPFQRQGSQYYRQTNQYGALAFEPSRQSVLKSATQLFQNGEIWGFNAHLLTQKDAAGKTLLPSQAIEQVFRLHLPRYMNFARDELGIALPYSVELGLSGIRGAYIAMPENYEWGPIHQATLAHRVIINSLDAKVLQDVLLTFFKKIYDLTGYPRPKNLYGFPPA